MKSTIAILALFFSLSFYLNIQAQVPEWAKGAVWYQIFPERFRNANTNNDPTKEHVLGQNQVDWQVHPWASDWYKLQLWEGARGQDFYKIVFDRRYGGDLLGVLEKLPYLKELGIDAIYFNPVFEAPSLHKYDAATYHHIDNNFGYDRDGDRVAIESEKEDPATWTWTQADKVFLELIGKAHEAGIKVIIDGVFNHCGTEFWAFKDVVEKQDSSRYRDWFDVTSWDNPATIDTNEFDYKGWWGFKGLPEFKEDENGLVPPVKKYIFDITRRWMDPDGDGDPSDGIDGWRLDVAEEVAPPFWQEWNRLVKSINPNAYAVAEIWEVAPDWIEQNGFDALMNYPLARLMVDFFIDQETAISAKAFDQGLQRLREAYPNDTNFIMLNLIDSHDTDRVGSMIRNPDRKYNDKAGVRQNPNYDPRKPDDEQRRIQKLIALFQMTYIGAPMIYYGDEAGMWGGKDPDDRKPMLWKEFVYEKETYQTVRPDLKDSDENVFIPDLYEHYRKLIKIRHENPALQKGNFNPRLVDSKRGLYGFSRSYMGNEVLVVFNNSENRQAFEFATLWKDKTRVKDLLNKEEFHVENGAIRLNISKKSGVILVREK